VITTPDDYFARLWAASPDPWEHATRFSEARKYELTVAALPRARYGLALEPACGAGLLTIGLASRADRVVASDRWSRARDETARRCAECNNVQVDEGDVRDGPGVQGADLAVISEVLYYFDVTTVGEILLRWASRLRPGADLVLVHYRPDVAEHVLDGDAVHDLATDVLGRATVALVDPTFRLDVFTLG